MVINLHLGPWTYGGVIIDAAGEELENGSRTFQSHNTHGGMVEANGQWYIHYHRCIGTNGYSRQNVVEPIEVKLEGDKVVIPEVEMTSMGFELNGLNPYKHYSAGFACYYSNGMYIRPDRNKDRDDWNPLVNIKNGCAAGYKYFNFDNKAGEGKYTELTLELVPNRVDGFIDVYLDRPSKAEGGTIIGTIPISSAMPNTATSLTIPVPQIDAISGKHAIFFKFNAHQSTTNICELNYFEFKAVDKPSTGSPVGIDVATETFDRYEMLNGDTVRLQINAIYADGTTANVTTQASVVIGSDNAVYNNGSITASAVGSGGITVNYGGFSKYIPFNVVEFLPRAGMITVDGRNVSIFDKHKFNYSLHYPYGVTQVPEIGVTLPSSRLSYQIKLPSTVPGTAEVIVSDANDNSATYKIAFEYSPISHYFAKGVKSDSWNILGDQGDWRIEKGKGLVLPTAGIGNVTGASSGVTYNNVFLTPGAGDWRIVAKVVYPAMPATYNSQQCGLYAWEDGNNYVTCRGLLNAANRVSVQRGKMFNGAWTQATGAANVNLVNGVIYYCLEKRDNLYCASYSTDGINFNNSNGDNIGQNGVPLRNVQIGLFAARAASGNPSVDVYCEYISVLTADGERIMANAEMLQNAVENVLSYVVEDIPKAAFEDFVLSPVPNGCTLTVTSDKPDVISNTGAVTRPSDKDEVVGYTIRVTEGTRTASKQLFITVPKENAKYVTVFENRVDDRAVNATIYNKTNTDVSATVIVAAYDSKGRLVKTALDEIVAGANETVEISINFALPEGLDVGSIKAYVWEKGTFIPLVDSTTLRL